MDCNLWHHVVQELQNIALGLDVMVQNEASITNLRQRLTAVQCHIAEVHEHYLYMHASLWHHFPTVASSDNPVAHTAHWVNYTDSYPLMPLDGACVYHANRQCESLRYVPQGSIMDIPGGFAWLWWRRHIWKPCDSCWRPQ